MKKKYLIITCIALLMIAIGCNNDNDVISGPSKGTFIDYGFIPAPVDASQNIAGFQTVIYNDNYVFVATSDGIWKNNLSTKTWSRAGLEGKKITAIYKHPTIANKFFVGVKSDYSQTLKTLYISNDGGITWQEGNNLIYDSLDNHYENYVCFAVRPNNPNHIYANLEGGTMLAISTDGGMNWQRMNNETESYFGYQSNIVFLPNNANAIYQGSENPLDSAWLGKYDINTTNPVLLSNFSKIIDMDVWDNRRPNELQTYPYTGNSIYIGLEGALAKVTEGNNKFIYKSENNNFPYSYIHAIWVDPNDSKHLLFGGDQNGGGDMNLYETYDEGTTIKRFTDKMGFDTPNVREIISTNSYPAIVICDTEANKVKLYLYKPLH
jgi:hypothetical protein